MSQKVNLIEYNTELSFPDDISLDQMEIEIKKYVENIKINEETYKPSTEEIMGSSLGKTLETGKDIALSISEGAQAGAEAMAKTELPILKQLIGYSGEFAEREQYEPKTGVGKIGYKVGEYGAPIAPGLAAFRMVGPISRGMAKRETIKATAKEGLSKLAKVVDKYAPTDFSGAKKLLRKSEKEIATDKKIAKEILEDQQLGDEVANTEYKTVKEQMFENASTLGNKTLTIEQLDKPEYIKKVGDDFRDSMNALYKNEAKKMEKAIDKIPEDIKFEPLELLSEIMPKLDDLALLDETGIKVTEFTSKPLLGKIIKDLNKMDKGTTKMTPLELLNHIKALDGAIDYAAIKKGSVRDRGMQVVRRLFRKKLGAVSKEYDELAKSIHDKLKAFGKKADDLGELGGGEKFALKNLTDQEVTEIGRVLKVNTKKNEAAKRALKEFDTISGWTSWNKHFGTNPGVLETLPYGGRNLEIVKSTVGTFLRPIRKKVVKGSLKRARKKGIKKYIKKARQEASGIKPKPKRKPLLKKAAPEIENILEREYIMEDEE